MLLDIPRIPAKELSVSEFLTKYYTPERPVVLTGLAPPCEGDCVKLVWDLAHGHHAEQRNGHIAAGTMDGDGRIRMPALVSAVFSGQDIVYKPKPLKLWMQPRGHQSLLHYDGNSLHGLNWQVGGRKRWLLMSPCTPVRMMPFTWVAMAGEKFLPDPDRYDFFEFETEPGDMLFLPRYWAHRVTCMDECNANLNWVWTPAWPNLDHAVGRRECATLKLRSLFGRFNRHVHYRVSLTNYADGGEEISDRYSGAVGMWQLFKTFAREMLSVSLLPFFGRDVERQMRRMSENNFPQSLSEKWETD